MLQVGHRLQQLEGWADMVAGDGGCEADTSNSSIQRVRGLASPDPVLDVLWWSGAGLVAPFLDVIETIRKCMTSCVGLVPPFDVDSDLWKAGVV